MTRSLKQLGKVKLFRHWLEMTSPILYVIYFNNGKNNIPDLKHHEIRIQFQNKRKTFFVCIMQ